MDRALARKICALVAGILEADGEMHPKERTFLRRVVARFGLSSHGETDLVPTVEAGEAARAVAGLPEPARYEALDLLVDAAVVDGRVAPEERRYLDAVGAALGASPEDLERHVARRLAAHASSGEGRASPASEQIARSGPTDQGASKS